MIFTYSSIARIRLIKPNLNMTLMNQCTRLAHQLDELSHQQQQHQHHGDNRHGTIQIMRQACTMSVHTSVTIFLVTPVSPPPLSLSTTNGNLLWHLACTDPLSTAGRRTKHASRLCKASFSNQISFDYHKIRLYKKSEIVNHMINESRSLYVVVRPSVCNVRAHYSGDWNFRHCFYAI